MQLHIRPLAKNEKFLNSKYFFQKVAKSVRFASEMSGLRIGKLLKVDFRFVKLFLEPGSLDLQFDNETGRWSKSLKMTNRIESGNIVYTMKTSVAEILKFKVRI